MRYVANAYYIDLRVNIDLFWKTFQQQLWRIVVEERVYIFLKANIIQKN